MNPICPNCKNKLTGAFNLDDDEIRGPEAGDMIVCGHCGQIGVFTENLAFAKPSENDFKKLNPKEFSELMAVHGMVMARINKRN